MHWLHKKFIQLVLLKITKNFVWACVITEQIVIYLLMVSKLLNSKPKNSEIVATALWVGNVSNKFLVDNMKIDQIKWICFWF